MSSRYAILLLLLTLAFALSGCAGSCVVDQQGYAQMLKRFPSEMQSRGIASLETTSAVPSPSYGEVLYKRLSPDFIYGEQGHHLYMGENFHKTLTPHSRLTMDGDGRGFSIAHPTQRLAMRMLAVVDWNGDGDLEWLTRCTVETYRGGKMREYYVLVPDPANNQGMLHGMICATADMPAAGLAPVTKVRDTSSFGKKEESIPKTEVHESLPGERMVTQPPSAEQPRQGGIQERDI